MEESTVVKEWIAMGEKRGEAKGKEMGEIQEAQTTILRLGVKKFGSASKPIETAVRAIQDHTHLQRILDRLFDATDWDNLIATI